MKNLKASVIVFFALWANISLAQEKEKVDLADSTGLPGDHFSLQGAFDLFKTSASPEDFEKKLNTENNAVNNLDLNGDNEIDYIRVIDNMKDGAHAIALQVSVNETEYQDVAVIEIEKSGNESAIAQIIGDDELYGESAIVEPFDEKEIREENKGEKGPSLPNLIKKYVVVNVWFWPCVRFIYAPAYLVWVSPWRWHHYPTGWAPWKPHPWRWHEQHCRHYYSYYRPVHVHRVMVAHKVYADHRKTSMIVKTRHQAAHAHYKAKKMSAKPHSAAREAPQKPINKSQGKPNAVQGKKSVNKSPVNKTPGAAKPGGNKAQRSGGKSTGKRN